MVPVDLEALYQNCAAFITEVWPEVVVESSSTTGGAQGIYFAEDLASLPFKTLKTPFAVIYVNESEKVDLGHVIGVHEVEVHLYYIKAVDDPPDTNRSKIAAMQVYLDTPGRDLDDNVGQLLWSEGVSTSRHLPLNSEFIDRQMPHRGGAIRMKCWIGGPSA